MSRVYGLVAQQKWDECARVIPSASLAEVNHRDSDQWTPLLQACEKQAPAHIVGLLLDKGAEVNAQTRDHWTALLYACVKQAPVEVIRMLLDKGANVNAMTKDHWTPLLYACEKESSPAVVRLLVEKGADTNILTKTQWTALLYACEKQAPVEIIEVLVDAGADVNATTKDQWTPLLYACDKLAPFGVMRVLVEKGAHVNVTTKEQWTPLIYAVEKQAPTSVVQLLVDAGANVNALTKDQWSPLLYACEKQAPLEVIELLLSKGADPSQRNKSGQTPLDRETRPDAQLLLKRSLISSPSSKANFASSRSKGSAESAAFFTELFAKAEITESAKQRDYTSRLQKESINTPAVLAACTKDELKKFGIAFGDAIRLLDACKKMQPGLSASDSASSSFSTRQLRQALDTAKATVMISYQWDSKAIALQVRDYLLGLDRFNVIMDMTGIHGNFLEWMEEGVQACDALIMLITPKYQTSTNCRAEACRAHELKRKMVPITLDPEYTGAGWLAPVIAGFMRYDGSTPSALSENLETIVTRELPHAS